MDLWVTHNNSWWWSMFISNWSLYTFSAVCNVQHSLLYSTVQEHKKCQSDTEPNAARISWLYMCTLHYYLSPTAMWLWLCSISARTATGHGPGQGRRLSFTSQHSQPAGGDPSLGEDETVRDTRRMFWSNHLISHHTASFGSIVIASLTRRRHRVYI